jgi:Fe2+ or Zn2+ uptake regulation protein
MSSQNKEKFSMLLREGGYKATQSRLSLLQVLAKADKPLSIASIVKEVGSSVNQATLYRAVEALADVGIIRRIDMQHPHMHYELAGGKKHHHHLICKKCGRIEDVENCDVTEIEHAVLKKSKHFSVIQTHSLEFFGLCIKCNNGKV